MQLYLISTVRSTIHANPSSKRRDLKTPALRFSVDQKHLKKELYENDDVTIIMPVISSPE